MRRRTRFIAGMLTFVALIFSLAEGVWASTCTPTMEMSAASVAASHEMPARHDGVRRDPGERHGPGVPDCPFSPAGAAQGCLASASLPAASATAIAPSPEDATQIVSTETEPHILLGSTFFHPPKA